VVFVFVHLSYTAWEAVNPMPAAVIQTAMTIIIEFSVSDMNPRGTLLDPPTQAHFSSRLSTWTALKTDTAPTVPIIASGTDSQFRMPATSARRRSERVDP
jgi:hypothetical protein